MTDEQILKLIKLISETFVAIKNYDKKQNDRTIQRNLQKLIKEIDIKKPGFLCENTNSGGGPIFLSALDRNTKQTSMGVATISDTLARMYVLEFIRYRGSAACKHSLFNMTYKMSSKQLRENNGLAGLFNELKTIPAPTSGGFTLKFKSILPPSVWKVTDEDFATNAKTLAKICGMSSVAQFDDHEVAKDIQIWKQKLLGLNTV